MNEEEHGFFFYNFFFFSEILCNLLYAHGKRAVRVMPFFLFHIFISYLFFCFALLSDITILE